MKKLIPFLFLLWPELVSAQPSAGVFTTVKTTNGAATSLCVGCPSGSTTPATNSGLTVHMITMKDALPSVTTNRIYNVGGALFFNGLSLATGSSISGTTGTVPKFTAATTLGDSNITISGTTVTVTGTVVATTNFSGPGALLTGIPTSAVSTGNYVATVASGTGITSTVTSGNAAATTINLANTAVTPSTYGSSTAISVFTVDQQGRITNATTATPQLTLTSTYFSSLAATNLTSIPAANLTGTITSATQDLITRLGSISVSVAPSGGGIDWGSSGSRWSTVFTGAMNASGTVTGVAGTYSGVLSTTSSLAIAATQKLYLDGVAASGDTYIQESSANVMSLFSGGVESKLTSGVLTVGGFGAHTFSAGGAAANYIRAVNTTSGVGAHAYFSAEAGTTGGELIAFSQGYTTSGAEVASSIALFSESAGGLRLGARHASGVIGLYTGGSSMRWGVNAAGDFTFGASSNIADSSGTPTIGSGFGGGGVTIAGTDYAIYISEAGASTGGVVNFGHTWSTAPVCVANGDTAAVLTAVSSQSTSTVTISKASSTQNIKILCRSY